jgi:hypothetical protein
VDVRRLWSGGAATAVVAGLAALVGVLVSRWLFRLPVLPLSRQGAPGDGGTTGLVLTAAAAALASTALVHLLMVSTPRPLMFFGWTCHAAGISGLSEAAAGAAQSSASRRREGC